MAKDNSDIFDSSALSAREQVTEWVNVKEKLGTRVAGKYIGFWKKPAEGKFKAQVGIALQDFDDAAKVFGVNLPEYYEGTVATWCIGDKVGVEYYKDIPAKEAGLSATKALRLFNPTQKEREKAGSKPAPQVEVVEKDLGGEEDQGF